MKIGLALGSGLSRGWAHIGALRVVVEAGYAPQVVAGSSIGAVVGGCYLARALDPLESFARALTRRKMLGLLDFKLRGGLLGGDKLAGLLRRQLGTQRVEDLPQTFIPVAAELETGHEIWLREGLLADAIRASYALPGLFHPVAHDHHWLIDGALVNPVPVSACRAHGARLVIAVNLNQEAFGRGNLSGESIAALASFSGGVQTGGGGAGRRTRAAAAALMQQVFGGSRDSPSLGASLLGALNIVQDRLARSRLAGDPPDVMITPRLGHISLFEFDRAEEAIALGAEAARAALPAIKDAAARLC